MWLNAFSDIPPYELEIILFVKSSIRYPLFRDENLCQRLLQETAGENLGDSLIPVYDPQATCIHQNGYDPSENSLIKLRDSITIFHETSETIRNVSVYARPTIGVCRCLQQTGRENNKCKTSFFWEGMHQGFVIGEELLLDPNFTSFI